MGNARALILTSCLLFQAAPALSAQTVGWRGNWTGRFPEARPPVTWSKLSPQMKALRCQAGRPTDGKPAGTPAHCGALTEWLVLGPFPADDDAKKAVEQEFVKDEAGCSPKEGDAVGGLRWKKVQVTGSVVDFAAVLAGEMPAGTPAFRYAENLSPHYGKPFVAYAHTYVYSAVEATFRFRVRSVLAARVYVNGKVPQEIRPGGSEENPASGEFSATLNKGWNRVLCKVRNFVKPEKNWRHLRSWYIDLGVTAARPYRAVSENIAWATLLPNYHVGCPLIVGDRIFVLSKHGDLICLRKSDGKVLWLGSTTYYDVLTAKDKADNPEFEKAGPLVAEIAKIDAAYVAQGTMTEEAMQKKSSLHKQVIKLMGRVDKKYRGFPGHHPHGDMPTAVSDGKHVYVWSGLGVASCHDLDGKRKWVTMPGVRDTNPDRCVSPVLADGKMIVYNGLPGYPSRGDLVAFDMQSGEIVWRKVIERNAMSSVVAVRIGGEEFVYHEGLLVRARDGEIVVDEKSLAVVIPTPVVDNGTVYAVSNGGDVKKAKLPTGPGKMTMSNQGGMGLGSRSGIVGEPFIPSPLCHDGLLYILDHSGRLYVMDAATMKMVYERDLGLGKGWAYEFYHAPDWCYPIVFASPMLAGGNIYVFALNGTAVVFQPGRQYREVARNKIEDALLSRDNGTQYSTTVQVDAAEVPEHFASTPVAEGGRIYIRGGKYLYCLGEK